MGFTPLEGLVMATRAGSVDPGLVLWLMQQAGLTAQEVGDGLEQGSGLVGLAGTADMRAVVERAAGGDADAALAFDVYTHRLRREIGAMTAALGAVDLCVFTGGIGEHAPAVRAASGLTIDRAANAAAVDDGDTEISAPGARRAYVRRRRARRPRDRARGPRRRGVARAPSADRSSSSALKRRAARCEQEP